MIGAVCAIAASCNVGLVWFMDKMHKKTLSDIYLYGFIQRLKKKR